MISKKVGRRLLFWSLEILIVATFIWVCTKIDFLFRPIGTIFQTLFVPILLAGFFFYLLNPLVTLLMKIKFKNFKISKIMAIIIVFFGFLGIVISSVLYIVPTIIMQAQDIILNIPSYIKGIHKFSLEFFRNNNIANLAQSLDMQQYTKEFSNSASELLKSFMNSFSLGIGGIISAIANATIVMVTVPLILFYMLKDGDKFLPAVSRLFPVKHTQSIQKLLKQMSLTISRYIAGQAIESLTVACLSTIGYFIIGVPYALLIGLFAGITNIIPYIGPYIGLLPALVLASSHSLGMVLSSIIVVIIVQQIDGNFVYPNVIGKSLEIHPLTIILLLLVVGNLGGLFGMILGVPTYAVAKVVIKYLVDIWKLHSENRQ